MADYLNQLIDRFWQYRDFRFANRSEIFSYHRKQPRTPVVFRPEFSDLNVVAPASRRQEILGTLRVADRHKWFSSMRSSQALTQSVFGTLKVLDKLHLLANVLDENGDPAFFSEAPKPSVCHLEYPCTSLGELRNRETKSDVFFGGATKVSVECKLAEDAFGACSQPTLRPTDPNYERDLCDGTYMRQRSRLARCSLSDKGILYWKRIPGILKWDAETDHLQCPLRVPYQLVRNILASDAGHAVLVYDSRNPHFQHSGDCMEAFEAVRKALHEPHRVRRISWQAICGAIAKDPDVRDFVQELKFKYGFCDADRASIPTAGRL